MSTRDMKSGVECMLLEKMRMLVVGLHGLSESCLSRVTSPKGFSGSQGERDQFELGKSTKTTAGNIRQPAHNQYWP
jgi:hypothetical protein